MTEERQVADMVEYSIDRSPRQFSRLSLTAEAICVRLPRADAVTPALVQASEALADE